MVLVNVLQRQIRKLKCPCEVQKMCGDFWLSSWNAYWNRGSEGPKHGSFTAVAASHMNHLTCKPLHSGGGNHCSPLFNLKAWRAGAISNLLSDNVFVRKERDWQKCVSNLQTLHSQRRANNGGFVGIHMKISHALTLSLQSYCTSSATKKNKNAVEHDTVHWFKNNMAIGRIPGSNVMLASALIWSSLSIFMKNFSKVWKFFTASEIWALSWDCIHTDTHFNHIKYALGNKLGRRPGVIC